MKALLRLFSILCMAASFNANAISIDLIADKNAINLGDSLEVQVRISGLDGSTALGVYDVNVNYDASLFSLGDISWGDSLLGNQLDLSGFGSLQDSISGSGWLNLFELSFDAVTDLENYQAAEFTLFSILFKAIAIGSGDFFVTNNVTGDAYGNDLIIDTINSMQVAVNSPVSVPEPSSLLMLALGLLAVAALRTKLMSSSK